MRLSHSITESGEALSSGLLLIQHGINLIQGIRQLAEGLRGNNAHNVLK